MLVFIDESGDPGFLVEQGSTSVFVVAMVIFEDGAAARVTEDVLRDAGRLGFAAAFAWRLLENREGHARFGFFMGDAETPRPAVAVIRRYGRSPDPVCVEPPRRGILGALGN